MKKPNKYLQEFELNLKHQEIDRRDYPLIACQIEEGLIIASMVIKIPKFIGLGNSTTICKSK